MVYFLKLLKIILFNYQTDITTHGWFFFSFTYLYDIMIRYHHSERKLWKLKFLYFTKNKNKCSEYYERRREKLISPTMNDVEV